MARNIIETWMDWLSGLVSWVSGLFSKPPEEKSPLDDEIDRALEKVEGTVQEVLSKYPLPQLVDDLRNFAGIAGELASLVGLLVREAEEFEKKSGREKKEFVVAAFVRIYERYELDLPSVPKALERPLLELFLDFTIDYTVELLNRGFSKNWKALMDQSRPA